MQEVCYARQQRNEAVTNGSIGSRKLIIGKVIVHCMQMGIICKKGNMMIKEKVISSNGENY